MTKICEFSDKLSYHIAKKKIKYYDPATGKTVSPTTPNGIKLELFIFDVFPYIAIDKFCVLQVDRKGDFSPLKNASGSDSAETSRIYKMMILVNLFAFR